MKNGSEASAQLNMNMTMNTNVKMKMKLNTLLQMGTRCCRFAGDPASQVKATGQTGPPLHSAPEGVPRRNVNAVIPDVNPADWHEPVEAEMSRGLLRDNFRREADTFWAGGTATSAAGAATSSGFGLIALISFFSFASSFSRFGESFFPFKQVKARWPCWS
jgi:hypothetical protein